MPSKTAYDSQYICPVIRKFCFSLKKPFTFAKTVKKNDLKAAISANW